MGVAFDLPAWRVLRILRDTGLAQRLRIDPGGMHIARDKINRAVRHDLVEIRLLGIGVWKYRKIPAAAPDAGAGRSFQGVAFDGGQDLLRRLQAAELELVELDSAQRRMDMGVHE